MSERDEDERGERLALTRDIIASYVRGNEVAPEALPDLITRVYQTLQQLEQSEPSKLTTQEPAVPIEQSITDDAIICLEDGLPFKSLKRHLRTKYDLTPAAYCEKWGLPADYPMVAPNYAKQRSELARQSGLGRRAKT